MMDNPLCSIWSCFCADVSAPAASAPGQVPDALVHLAIRPLDIGQTPAGGSTPAPMPPALKELAGTAKAQLQPAYCAGLNVPVFPMHAMEVHTEKDAAGSSEGPLTRQMFKGYCSCNATACMVMYQRPFSVGVQSW